jgi:ubiquinone/menaquinone biosynthesis C-methylase UbiE
LTARSRPSLLPSPVSYRIKLLLFFLSALAVLALMDVGYSALNTLSRLDVVEAQRDQWQRPADVIQALAIKPGARVVDLGCGSGYFTLRLSTHVGARGSVIAEDIRRLPLAFLWTRTVIKGAHNVHIILGRATDPRLPEGREDAVLIANTFHELADPQSILARVNSSLVPGGRLVVLDREPRSGNAGIAEAGEHEIAATRVEDDLRLANFQVVSVQDPFISGDPDGETWWMIVARKPKPLQFRSPTD